jgi:hypothetical protein
LWDLQDHKAPKDPVVDHKAHKDHKDPVVDHKAHKDRKDPLVILDHKALAARKGHKAPLVILAHKDHRVLLEPLAHLDQLEDHRVLVVHKVQLVPLGCLAQLVLKDWADHKVHKDHRAPKAILTPLPVQHH